MDTGAVSEEVEKAFGASEEIRRRQFDLDQIDAEITKLELKCRTDPSQDTRMQLLTRYIFLARWLPVGNSRLGIKARERFQQQLPDHFIYFMDRLKASASSTRWSGCIACKHNLGHGCAKGLQPSKVSSRYLDRDYECSALEAK
jgi:hypothetical protein